MTIAPPWLPVAEMADLMRVVAETSHEGTGDDILISVDGARLARQLRHSGRGVVGLLPTGPDPLIQPLARQVGFALSRLTQTLTIVLDPEQRSGFSPDLAQPASGAFVYAQCAAPAVAVLSPFEVAPMGAKFEMIRVLMQFVEEPSRGNRGEAHGQVLVDLTGCQRPGELLGAIQMLEGIIVVGRSGQVTESEILAAVRGVPDELNLGVVITE